jgi:hypothetical protein
MTASFAFDHDRAPTHPVAGAITGIAAYPDNATTHACDFARKRTTQPVASCANNFQMASSHPGRRPRASAALDDEPSALHAAPRFDPDIAVHQDFAANHFVPDEVEAVAGALDANVLRIPHAHSKSVADVDAVAGGAQLHSLDFRYSLSRQQMRHQRRQVEALIGALPQREHKRLHDSSSFR